MTLSEIDPNRVLIHVYSSTTSSWNIEKWNINDNSKEIYTLKETIDNEGRVVKLEFLENGKLIDDPLCYLANKVEYDYDENKVTETLYHFDEELLATECEMHYRTIYHLDDNNAISYLERFAKYNFDGLTETEIENWKIWVPEKVILTDTLGQNLQIEYYYHSFAKMNGIYPVNRQYKFIDDYYYGDEPEKSSILKAIENK
jgi:hypothetical protein